jgi:hypothetical protein
MCMTASDWSRDRRAPMAVDMRLVADDLQRIAAPLNEANAIVPQYMLLETFTNDSVLYI